MKPIMISCFDLSTIMAEPWVKKYGYEAYCVDIKHPKGITTTESGIHLVGADMLDWLPPRGSVEFAAFFPPCTSVAVSGARWFQDKGIGALIEALRLFDISVKIAENLGCPYLIENPVSTVSTYWRKPDYLFDPCDYGDPYTKRTCLWSGGGFVMPEKNRVEATEGSKMHRLPPTEGRAEKRSKTPKGFALAVCEVNRRCG